MPDFHFGYLLPTRGIVVEAGDGPIDGESILTLAKKAEGLGLDSVWLGDSILAKPRLESFTTWSAALAATRRVQVGTAVMLAALRHPVTLAQSLVTMDCLFPGRIVAGFGVGRADLKDEFETLGVPIGERARRLSETIEIVKGLMKGTPIRFEGKHFSLKDVDLGLRPVSAGGPPIWVASNNADSGLRRVARFADGWITNTITADLYRECWEKILASAEEAGRKIPDAFSRCLYVTMNIHSDARKAEKECGEFLSAYYHQPFDEVRKKNLVVVGDGAEAEDRIREYIDAGAEIFVIRFAGGSQEEQLENFASELLPRFR